MARLILILTALFLAVETERISSRSDPTESNNGNRVAEDDLGDNDDVDFAMGGDVQDGDADKFEKLATGNFETNKIVRNSQVAAEQQSVKNTKFVTEDDYNNSFNTTSYSGSESSNESGSEEEDDDENGEEAQQQTPSTEEEADISGNSHSNSSPKERDSMRNEVIAKRVKRVSRAGSSRKKTKVVSEHRNKRPDDDDTSDKNRNRNKHKEIEN